MRAVPSIQAKAVEKIIKSATARGVPARALYEAIKLNPPVLTDPDQRIPFAQVVALYERAAELTGDDAFGLHVGEAVDPKAFDVLGYAVINSPTLGEALDRMVRYNFIWTNGSCFSVDATGALTRIVYEYLDHTITERRHDTEMTLAAIAALGRTVANFELSPARVTFQHDSPRDTREHARIFQCSVEFNASKNQYFLDSRALELPIVKADPGLIALLDRHAAELVARFSREDTLRDKVRHELALRYLREPELAVCEVAYLLGFSESSAFHRAFKRWTGTTPNEFRRR